MEQRKSTTTCSAASVHRPHRMFHAATTVGAGMRLLVLFLTLTIIFPGALMPFGRPRHCADAQEPPSNSSVGGDAEVPFVIFSANFFIFRMPLDGVGASTSEPIVLVYEMIGGIRSVDYHFKLGYLFWTNVEQNNIKRSRLDGTDITTLVKNVDEPSDLSVDWVNDKIYWTEGEGQRIGCYDLHTMEWTVVLETGPGSKPWGIAVDPFTGWLYWTDRKKTFIERALVNGSLRTMVHENAVPCARPLSLDYSSQCLYWSDSCNSNIELSSVGGSHREVFSSDIPFADGLVQYRDHVYWTQPLGVFRVPKDKSSGPTQLYTSYSTMPVYGLQIVDSRSQPLPESDILISDCSPACINGFCLDPKSNLCDCLGRWSGDQCETDIDECVEGTHDCRGDLLCSNTNGGYTCHCSQGTVPSTINNTTCVPEVAGPTDHLATTILATPSSTWVPHMSPSTLGSHEHHGTRVVTSSRLWRVTTTKAVRVPITSEDVSSPETLVPVPASNPGIVATHSLNYHHNGNPSSSPLLSSSPTPPIGGILPDERNSQSYGIMILVICVLFGFLLLACVAIGYSVLLYYKYSYKLKHRREIRTQGQTVEDENPNREVGVTHFTSKEFELP